MNTVFKFYNTVWCLLAIAGAVCLYRGLLAFWDVLSDPKRTQVSKPYLLALLAWASFTALILGVAALSFPVNLKGVLGVTRVSGQRPILDGTDYLRKKFPSDSLGIEWLNQEVSGTATVLEAWGPAYQDFTRVSMHTGLSTVLGWEHHVSQRGQSRTEIEQRKRAIKTIYTSRNSLEITRLLRRYEIDYVFVGEQEAKAYGAAVVNQFDGMPGLEPVFSHGRTRIYRFLEYGAIPSASIASPQKAETSEVGLFLPPSAPGLEHVGALALGPDDELFALSWPSGSVETYSHGGRHERSLAPLLETMGARLGSLTVGPDGRLWGADTWKHRILEISADGQNAILHGQTEGLRFPRGVAIDSDGQLWVADTGNDRLLRLGASPQLVTETPDGPLLLPVEVCAAPEGGVLVLSLGHHAVYSVGPEGEVNKLFSLPHEMTSELGYHASLAVEAGTQVIVSNPAAGNVWRFDPDFGLEDVSAGIAAPTGLAADRDGNLFIGDGLRGGVYLLRRPVKHNAFQGGRGSELGQFEQPRGVAWNEDGTFWVADFRNHRIQKIRRDGMPIFATGSAGDQEGEFREPCDVASLPEGRVAVADTWNHRIQIFDARGKFIRAFSGGFFGPRGIALSSEGLLYVTDTGNATVKVFDLKGRLVRHWGGKGSVPGKFDNPVGIAIRDARVYVADANNSRVQIFDLQGVFLDQIEVPGWKKTGGQEPHLTIDARGRLLATVPAEHRVVWLAPGQGVVGSFGGTRKHLGGRLVGPTGIDARGTEILVSSTSGHQILKFDKTFP